MSHFQNFQAAKENIKTKIGRKLFLIKATTGFPKSNDVSLSRLQSHSQIHQIHVKSPDIFLH